MRFSLTAVFFLLFLLAVSAYLRLMPDRTEKQSVLHENAYEKLLDLHEGDQIVSVRIEDRERPGRLVLVKQNTGWFIEEPIQGAADRILAEGLEAALRLSKRGPLMKPESGWRDYGLDKPRAAVEITLKQSQEPRKLLFGDKAAVGNSVFARWEKDPDYFLTDPNLLRAFLGSPYSFREKRIFLRPLKGLSRMKVQNDAEVYEIKLQESGWVWAEPIDLLGRPFASESADQVMGFFRGLFVKEFIAGEPQGADKGFGLLSPETLLEMAGSDASLEKEVLRLGDELPVRDAYYAHKEGSPEVFLVARDKIGEVFAFFRTLTQAERSHAVQKRREGNPAV